jgi:hypothetical protein
VGQPIFPSACCLLHAWFLFDLHFDPEYRGGMCLRSVATRRGIPEDWTVYSQQYENLKSNTYMYGLFNSVSSSVYVVSCGRMINE